MEKEELLRLKDLIERGKIIKEIEKELSRRERNVCSVCENEIGEDYYELIWKTNGLIKKAKFDAIDCLDYFITALRNRKK